MRSLFLIVGLWLVGQNAFGQDPQFSQFYANPLYLNPAFAGSKVCPRLNINFRDQWPALTGEFVTYSASFDQYVNFLGGGVGVLMTADDAGDGILTTNRLSLIYSKHFSFDKNTNLRFGFEATVEEKGVHNDDPWNDLVLPDRITPDKGISNPIGEVIPSKTIYYPDFSAGFLFTHSDFYAGFAVHHLSEPNQSLLPGNRTSLLPKKYTAHVGMNIFKKWNPRRRELSYLAPQIIFQQQRDFNEVNVGFYAKKGPITGGFWYRTSKTRDAAIISLGVESGAFKFGYSYDLTVSSLGMASAGSHEISTSYVFKCRRPRKRLRVDSCPSF